MQRDCIENYLKNIKEMVALMKRPRDMQKTIVKIA
jgi:hypothetical protein